ncbi:phospholipase D family protein [Aurantimonas sp. HBX-1]|uniref:phospholipase D family protein n=1 Tax=Aurantimonas sp. HBX-1 TaxID=2906072 RepID=UPI001F18735D|nr:phospholipase D family protein [Aurantimonas sp. HBX-1]UIJ70714.1 phospholipase D family protein [Aurantimonas sp. HBX-1]
MSLVAIIAGGAVALCLAILVFFYAFGRVAHVDPGTPSFALPPEDAATELDRDVAAMLREHPGESGLMLIAGGIQAFAARALAARIAGRSLDLQYYYWLDDLTGGLLARELIRAADRGVRVRLLLDDINTRGRDRSYLALDRHPNVEVRLFNPAKSRSNALHRGVETLLRPFSATRRMHNKAWIADGRVAIVGGRNVGDAYFDASDTANFRDMDLLAVGPVVGQAATVFDDFWNSSAVLPIRKLARYGRGDLSTLQRLWDGLTAGARAAPFMQRLEREGAAQTMLCDAAAFHWTAEARVISDPPEKAHSRGQKNWLWNEINPVVLSARSHLEIVSPYFIPGYQGVRRLHELAAKGVDITILTNSLAATDVAAVHGAYANYRAQLLQGGIALFELRPRRRRDEISLFGSRTASLHTKAFTVDGEAGFIGSFNFDPRSVSLNTEMGVLFRQAALTRAVRAVVMEQMAPQSSYRVMLKNGSLAWQDGMGPDAREERRDPETTVWRRMAVAVIGFLPIESQL